MRKGMKGEGMVFGSTDEVQYAVDTGAVHLHAKVTARLPQIDAHGAEYAKRFETTPGRVLLGALLPHNSKAPFELVNELLRKKRRAAGNRHSLSLLRSERICHFLRSDYDYGFPRSV
jgi:DNA-directed RNA polymerase subunit beta'